MKGITISVNDCQPGMKMAETIYNQYGAVIVGEGTILDQHLILKIQRLGIDNIKIYSLTDKNLRGNSIEVFKEQYNENLSAVKSILHDISTGKNVDVLKINKIARSISMKVNDNRDIVNSINQIRHVDEYTYTHSLNVSMLCMLIGKWLKYDVKTLGMLIQAGLLHDIGKGKIDPVILNKPTSLDRDEYEIMKKHSLYGYMLTEGLPGINDDVRKGVLMHHEREDGSGYPLGVKGDQIHSFAKIIAVADIYDAMTSNRAYRPRESPFEVFDMMENNTFGILDTRVVKVFLGNMAAYYIGDYVRLNTGNIGEIVYINPMRISQPIIRVEDAYTDLAEETKVKILELV